jgi:putative ABC transport system permease protein
MIADFDTYMNNFEQLLSSTKAVYTILLAVGMIVCVLIVNLLAGMIIDENNRNISMLKVLGYHDREIGNIILSPNHFLLPCCYLLAIPVTAYMAKLMMADSVTNSGIWIDVVIKPQTIVIYFVIVAIAYLVSLVFAKRRLDRVEMTASLKQED